MKSDLSARPRPPAHQRDNTFFSFFFFFFKATELGAAPAESPGPRGALKGTRGRSAGLHTQLPTAQFQAPPRQAFPARTVRKGGEGEGRSWAWPCPAAERSTHPRLACEVRAGDPQAENKGDAPARSARARARPSPSPPREMAAAPQNGSR